MNICCVCEKTTGVLYKEENNPHDAILCSKECQMDYHGLNIGFIPPNPTATSNAYKSAQFYIESAKLLRRLKNQDVFAYLCLSHYGQQSAVNPILFKSEGNWYRFKEFPELMTKFDPSVVFRELLYFAPSYGVPFKDKTERIIITNHQQLVQYYPEIRPYLQITDRALFIRLYISAINGTILGIPKSLPFVAWRGYSPVPIPNSLSMNVLSYKPGQRVVNWGLGSLSIEHKVSASFANSQQMCCMMYVHIPSGFPAFMLTSDASDKIFPHIPTAYSQMEVLLPPGVIFQIGRRMGKRVYQPYAFTGTQAILETIEVFIVGISANKGYIPPDQRIKGYFK